MRRLLAGETPALRLHEFLLRRDLRGNRWEAVGTAHRRKVCRSHRAAPRPGWQDPPHPGIIPQTPRFHRVHDMQVLRAAVAPLYFLFCAGNGCTMWRPPSFFFFSCIGAFKWKRGECSQSLTPSFWWFITSCSNQPIVNMASVTVQTPLDVSSDRVEPGSFPLAIARFPDHAPKCEDPDSAAAGWVGAFNSAAESSDIDALSKLFLVESYWRDQLCLSWDFHTLHGPEKIVSLLKQSKNGIRVKSFALDKTSALRSSRLSALDADGKLNTVSAFLKVETDVGKGAGMVRLVLDDGVWKAFTLFTFLKQLTDHEEFVGRNRPNGVANGELLSRKNWLDQRTQEENMEDGEEPTVLILGISHESIRTE
jgi:hypothetical protein